jgi:hypothetical protein
MNDRSKTAWILGIVLVIIFSPLVLILAGYQIPMLQNLGFERNSIAPPIVWILATVFGIFYAHARAKKS